MNSAPFLACVKARAPSFATTPQSVWSLAHVDKLGVIAQRNKAE
jgi:hypothetical protein